jgi:hypothetical protein
MQMLAEKSNVSMILNYQKRNAKPHCEIGRVNEPSSCKKKCVI